MYGPIKFVLAVLCVVSLSACAASRVQEQDLSDINGIVATVNGEALKKAEHKRELDSTYQRIHQTGQIIDGSMYEQLKTEVRESLINLIILDQYSQRQSIKVDEALVEKHYQKAVNQYASKKAYEKSLKEAGLTETDLRTRIKRTLAAQKVVESQIAPEIQVTQKEIKEYYDANVYEFEHDVQVHAAHILIKVSPFADHQERQESKKRIIAIQDRIKAGEDFAALAKEYSEGPSKVNGGDIGYFGAAQMAPAFETAAFALQPGEVSNVVTTQFGYHIIKVYDRKPAGKEPLSEAAPRLKARFYKERVNESLRQLVEKLKADAQIDRLPLD